MGAITPVTKRLWLARLAKKGLGALEGSQVATPVARPPQRLAVPLPFTTDQELAANYRNPWDRVRVGRLLEDLDSLAGNIAFAHCDDGDPG